MTITVRILGVEVLHVCTDPEVVEYEDEPTALGSLGIAAEVYADSSDVTMGFTLGFAPDRDDE